MNNNDFIVYLIYCNWSMFCNVYFNNLYIEKIYFDFV